MCVGYVCTGAGGGKVCVEMSGGCGVSVTGVGIGVWYVCGGAWVGVLGGGRGGMHAYVCGRLPGHLVPEANWGWGVGGVEGSFCSRACPGSVSMAVAEVLQMGMSPGLSQSGQPALLSHPCLLAPGTTSMHSFLEGLLLVQLQPPGCCWDPPTSSSFSYSCPHPCCATPSSAARRFLP